MQRQLEEIAEQEYNNTIKFALSKGLDITENKPLERLQNQTGGLMNLSDGMS